MSVPANLVELLRARADGLGDRRLYTFLRDGEGDALPISFGELERRARAVAARLQAMGAHGQRALLLYAPSVDYVVGFFGCLFAGVVAVPVYPPDMARPQRSLPRLAAIAEDAQATLALTTSDIQAMASFVFEVMPSLAALRWVATDTIPDAEAETWRAPPISPTDLVFLQYTSGSTSAPKGVMLSHENLLHNLKLIRHGFGTSSDTQGVIWLPPYHDMGLIGGLLHVVLLGAHVVLLSPLDFLRKPLRWLRAISTYRGTCSGGPNFAYDLCVRKTTPAEREGLDLSAWEVAFNGAEPIHRETLDRFATTFAPYGFRAEAFYACYGLAEGTLIASGGRKLSGIVSHTYDAERLRAREVVAVAPEAPGAQTLVGCGTCLPDQSLVIAEPETGRALPAGRVGEIWLRGPSVAQGYWNRPEETERAFGARLAGEGPEAPRFLRTGDLGFLTPEGELMVAGRLKDLIVIRGRNHYPQDLERTVETCDPALRPGCGAAFSVVADAAERLVVVQEIDRRATADEWPGIARAIREAVAFRHDVPVSTVALIAAGSIPKTSSGKIQRHACKAEFEAGTLEVVFRDALPAAALAVPEPLEGAAMAAAPEIAPAAPAESAAPADALTELAARTLAVISESLRLPPGALAPDASLYGLGLDSLAAVELKGALEAAFGVELPLQALLDEPTAVRLAGLIARAASPAAGSAVGPGPGAAAEAVAGGAASSAGEVPESVDAPLGAGQQALWFLQQLAPDSAAYHVPVALRLEGGVDADALRRALQRLVDRHPALRTTYPLAESGPVQRVHARSTLDFERAARPDAESARGLLTAEARRPFDLARGPLLRVRLVEVEGEAPILLLAFHHIAVDLWSLSVLAEELGVLYPAEVAGLEPPALPALGMAPADFAAEQAEALSGPRGAAARAHFLRALSGELPLLDLPTDRPRPPAQTYAGAVCVRALSPALSEALRALARARNTTLGALLQAAFQVLLHRYTGQDDLVVGVVGSGRSRAAHARLVAYCVNPLAVRTRPSPEVPFLAYLDETKTALFGALAHQDHPFGAVLQALGGAREQSRSPVFQAMFVFQRAPRLAGGDLTALALDVPDASVELWGPGGLRVTGVPIGHGGAQFDLTLTMGEAPGGLLASFEYNTDLFDAATIERLSRHFEVLLEGIAAQPDRRLSELPLMDADERAAVLAAAVGAPAELSEEAHIPARFAAWAARAPEAPAVTFGETTLTYGDLAARAAELASALHAAGVVPGEVVALCLPRCLEMLPAVLGVLGAGAAYVPLDPAHPPERLAALLADAGARIVLTVDAVRARLPAEGPPVLVLGAGGRLDTAPFPMAAWRSVHGGALACLIHTSGSSGRPKAVMLEHRALGNLVESFIRSYAVGPADRVLPLTALASASFVGEILPPLCAGAAVVLPTDEEVLDLAKLLALVVRQGVTIASTVPAVVAALNAKRESLAPLRLLLSGGEALSARDVEHLVGRVEVVNGYGLTETAVCATYHRLAPSDLEGGAWLPIGKPILNTSVHVLDAQLQPVPTGCAGEIMVGGEALARGYLNQPELTAARFIPDPFRPGGRLYRTGDLGRRRPDGSLQYLHRVDHQVKIRGHRIELGEVEAALRVLPGVGEAHVGVREDTPGDRRLVAYVVGAGLDGPTLSRALAERLPAPMIPAAFVFVAALPMSANGKVDTRALPAPTYARTDAATFVPPRSELERRIAAAWLEVLKLPAGAEVGTADNFFDLGGDSLKLAQLHRRLQEELGRSFPLLELFKHTTVAALAAHLSRSAEAGAAADGSAAEASAGEARQRIQSEAERRREALARRQQAGRTLRRS